MSKCDNCPYNHFSMIYGNWCRMNCVANMNHGQCYTQAYRQYLLSLYDIFLQKSFD